MFANKNKTREELELGFGSKNFRNVRFLNRDGSVNVKRHGLRKLDNLDIYHWLITTSWSSLLLVIIVSYTLVNSLFASVYFLIGYNHFGGISSQSEFDKFMDLFFFSAQTLTTVGYGHIYPNNISVSTVSAIESMLGLLGFALATGIIYGRFSRPKTAILYSEKVLISPYKNIKGLMFRVANSKQNELIETEASVVLTFSNPETNKREFVALPLERNKINFLTFSWTIVHPIDEQSPLYNVGIDELIKWDAELIILLKAINDTYSQTVYSRMSYKAVDFVGDAKFVPIKQEVDKSGHLLINLQDIHQYTLVQP